MTTELKNLLATVASAIEENADANARARGAAAAKTLSALLGATPGEPLVPPQVPVDPLARMVEQFKSTPQPALLDTLIAKLQSALPSPVEIEQGEGFRLPYVPLAGLEKKP